jgi:hypothetical protein
MFVLDVLPLVLVVAAAAAGGVLAAVAVVLAVDAVATARVCTACTSACNKLANTEIPCWAAPPLALLLAPLFCHCG